MRRTFALLIAAAVIVAAPLAYSQDKEGDEQIKQANEAAKKMGLKMPDMKALTEESDKEEAQEKAKEKAATQAAMDAKGPVALPDWTPQVPQFTPAGPVARKLVDGQPKTVLIGTSPLAPDALADAWDTFKNPKFSHERGGSDINHNVDLFVTFRNSEDGTEARMEAERKAGTKVTHVTVSSPLPTPKPATDDN